MKCESCRKIEINTTTWWERVRYRLMLSFFYQELRDFHQEKYTQGFGDGYKKGIEHERLNQQILNTLEQPIYETKDLFKGKEILETKIEKVFGNKDIESEISGHPRGKGEAISYTRRTNF